jgi:hypothetical protein
MNFQQFEQITADIGTTLFANQKHIIEPKPNIFGQQNNAVNFKLILS